MKINFDLGAWFSSKAKSVITYILSMATLVVVAKWDAVVSTFDKGAEIEKMEIIKSDMKAALQDTSVLNAAFSNPNFVATFFNNPTVNKKIEELGVELHNRIRDQIVEDVIKNDTNKISMRSFVGKEADIRDEQVLPLLAEIIKAYKEKEFAKKKDVKNIIKQEIKPTSLKRPIALF